MRTKIEYEPNDVTLDDPLHSCVAGLLLLMLIRSAGMTKAEREQIAPDGMPEMVRTVIADALNYLEGSDYALVRREPAIFRQ